jgi:hypothetical protein
MLVEESRTFAPGNTERLANQIHGNGRRDGAQSRSVEWGTPNSPYCDYHRTVGSGGSMSFQREPSSIPLGCE